MTPEFPHDNPELWLTPKPPLGLVAKTPAPPLTLTSTLTPSPPLVVAVAAAPAAESEAEVELEVEVAEFEESDFAVVENESVPPPPMPVADDRDAFQLFIHTLTEVALAAGAPARVVATLPGILGAARLDVQSLDTTAIDALVTAGLLDRNESGAITRNASFVANAQAWRASLLGEETEFSASTMLDEWSAHIVATLASTPGAKESLRRDLRARGIAAFGLLVAA